MTDELLYTNLNLKEDLTPQIRILASMFQERFGTWPQCCFINADLLPKVKPDELQIKVIARRYAWGNLAYVGDEI